MEEPLLHLTVNERYICFISGQVITPYSVVEDLNLYMYQGNISQDIYKILKKCFSVTGRVQMTAWINGMINLKGLIKIVSTNLISLI